MKRCMCGNGETLPGYRVCADCKAAREMYPHLFENDAPDAEVARSVQLELFEPETPPAAVFSRLADNSQEAGE